MVSDSFKTRIEIHVNNKIVNLENRAFFLLSIIPAQKRICNPQKLLFESVAKIPETLDRSFIRSLLINESPGSWHITDCFTIFRHSLKILKRYAVYERIFDVDNGDLNRFDVLRKRKALLNPTLCALHTAGHRIMKIDEELFAEGHREERNCFLYKFSEPQRIFQLVHVLAIKRAHIFNRRHRHYFHLHTSVARFNMTVLGTGPKYRLSQPPSLSDMT